MTTKRRLVSGRVDALKPVTEQMLKMYFSDLIDNHPHHGESALAANVGKVIPFGKEVKLHAA